jgi:hypothetical protein
MMPRPPLNLSSRRWGCTSKLKDVQFEGLARGLEIREDP